MSRNLYTMFPNAVIYAAERTLRSCHQELNLIQAFSRLSFGVLVQTHAIDNFSAQLSMKGVACQLGTTLIPTCVGLIHIYLFFAAMASFFSLLLPDASALDSVSMILSHHLNELE